MTAKAPHPGQTEADPSEAALEAFFAPARSAPALTGDLMARILEDAARVSGTSLAPAVAPALTQPAPRRGIFAALAAAVGGWPALGGMAAATIAGVWLGFSNPILLEPSVFDSESYSLSDFMPSVELAMADLDWTE